ncbi:preprotein translocase subunit SecG [Sphingorhabdus arenilitoris]|uniref:Protein-export membrane protein SecG n=1 Tax=Sphingorhabdus arenilitoris TaxID=1490041 RepID=A0ABV8RG13_9SPHN
MGLFHFLIVLQGIIAAALVGVILMQRSEGGGLGTGGSPSGLMSARGAADFMTRTTTALATLFVLLSISLAFVAARQSGGTIDDSFKRNEAPAAAQQAVPADGEAAPAGTAPAEGEAAPAAPASDTVPLDQ